RETYDYVFFDCPPIEIVADARLLNPFIDMTIFVMRSGLFEKADINVLRAIYNERRYNNLSLVLNATDEVHGLYGYYGYGYGYGYGYYKHQHRGKKKK
ncbi:MAG: chromosome partitioning protein ParA, partial [Muribaculaceae bacterium]|nr:chromosome partitioning protein ParA [Muribaculaceae bacterium]